MVGAISELLASAWSYKVSALPVLVTYFIFDAQMIYRRATRLYYVPIYFIVFPNGYSDKLYAEYFSEDDFYGDGEAMTEVEKEALRHKIIVSAIVSMVSTAIVAPYLCGSISATYLSHSQFVEFLVVLMTIKTALIAYALYNIRATSRVVNAGLSFYCVVTIYIAYLYFVWRGLTKSFAWTKARIEESGAWGVLVALGDFVHEDLFINIIAVTLITWVVQQHLTIPENISPKSADIEPGDSEASATIESSKSTRTY